MGKSGTQLNRLTISSGFRETLNDLNEKNIRLPSSPESQEMDFRNQIANGELVSTIEDMGSFSLDADFGEGLVNGERSIMAYDESINKFSSLEGKAFLISHSLILMGEDGGRSFKTYRN